jgi:Stage II sporulation protein E (SpoIIE)
VTVGDTPTLAHESADGIARVLRPPESAGTVVINDLLTRDRRVGYGYAASGTGPHYVVYVESALPPSRRSRVDSNSAFADLDYALFLGTKPNATQLIASSTGGVLLHGRQVSEVVPFGDAHILLVVKPSRELGGDLLARLPWALTIGGILLTLAGTFLVDGLLRRRDHAEALARENDELYREQRSVAQVLQHSLLPSMLPDITGLDLAARYVAGADDVDIGGDWYDVVILDDGRVVFVVGDVSGRGLRAATTMAELRYAFRAYATQGDAPEAILAKASRLISVGRDGHFATAVCGSIDVPGHRLDLANAGHPEPVLVANGDAHFIRAPVGVPLGVANPEPYSAVTVSIPMGATVLAYTDGLVERRGEHLDTGRERLRVGALDATGSIEDQVGRVVAHTIPNGSTDDTAILGLRWLD